MLNNSHRVLEVHFAAARAGAAVLNVNVHLVGPELAHILDDGSPMCIVAERQYARALSDAGTSVPVLWTSSSSSDGHSDDDDDYELCCSSTSSLLTTTTMSSLHEENGGGGEVAAAAQQSPSSYYQLYYTSGTTGKPKGVTLTHRIVVCHAKATALEMRLASSDVWGHFAPMFHLVDAFALYAITALGARHVILPRFDAARALAAIERERITVTNVASTMVSLMLSSSTTMQLEDLSSLRLMSCGGAPLAPATTLRAMATLGCEFFLSYGMTECCGKIAMSLQPPPPHATTHSLCSSGRPFALVDVRIVCPRYHDDTASYDEPAAGEVVVRGATVFSGYLHRAESARTDFLAGGWFCTGDLAVPPRNDEGAYFRIVDRCKDMVLVGGENVYTAEVEGALYAHPAVMQAAVFGVPNDVMGEMVAAAVVLKPGGDISPSSLQSFCRASLAAYKVPYSIRVLDRMSRDEVGAPARPST